VRPPRPLAAVDDDLLRVGDQLHRLGEGGIGGSADRSVGEHRVAQHLVLEELLARIERAEELCGRLKEAIEVYEAALKQAPGASEIEAQLSEWKKEASRQSRSYETRGAHFAVRFEGPGDELLARRAVERLESEYWRIGQTLTAYPPNPITVVLYTQQEFRDITRMPSWTAAAYDGRIHVPMRGALEQTEELDRVLGHEFVHAVVFMLGGRNVPMWLNEGLAAHLERVADRSLM